MVIAQIGAYRESSTGQTALFHHQDLDTGCFDERARYEGSRRRPMPFRRPNWDSPVLFLVVAQMAVKQRCVFLTGGSVPVPCRTPLLLK
jgi:hypothetical protein